MTDRERAEQVARELIKHDHFVNCKVPYEQCFTDRILAAMNEARLELLADIARPYPEDIFTPLTDNELERCVNALTISSGVRAASDRLHASWARYLVKTRRDEFRGQSTEAPCEGESDEV